MQAYTEEDRAVFAGLCRIEIKRWKAASESNPNMRYMVELMEITLAALTAEPEYNTSYAEDINLDVSKAAYDSCHPDDRWISYPAPPVAAPSVPDGFVMVPRTLTAENGAKAALLGEFNLEYNLVCHECFGEGCVDCSGDGSWTKSIPVDWTTIKEIWSKGIDHFQAAASEVE
ncbi:MULTISPECIES: hypothetical protein [unclassified Pantoea]|uniref:hypothetical protein n=1 Tax=unclassified Pantoea TaxID=2630326 RepID=UPI0001E0938A|nr:MULTISPECIES: hypothetical protein [unclassified Pantoea]EFM19308.1 putative DnaJ-class molecular chaperone with C-terminal Zn finger domain [Pantoea sp. aB]